MFMMYSRLTIVLVTVLGLIATPMYGEKVIIKTEKPYKNIVRQIERLGGTVTWQYAYADAIAADIPDSAIGAVKAQLPAGAVRKDHIVNIPPARVIGTEHP